MDARGERILSDINLAFKRDPAIDEYDYLPVLQATQNRSPVIVTMHKLALELWSTKILFQHAYSKLLAWRNREPKYKYLEPHEIVCLTRAVVMINADCCTAWNIRKELILSGDLKPEDCLKLGELVLTKHPKSVETFSHRKWLLKHLLLKYPIPQASDDASHREALGNNEQNQNYHQLADDVHPQDNSNGHHICQHHANTAVNQTLHNIFLQELKVCTSAASRYQCNYYAWNHRMWLMKHCLKYSFVVLLSELSWSKSWIQQHISDHSCFQYRQFLLREMSIYQQLRCPCTTSVEVGDPASDSIELSLHSNGCSQRPMENHLLTELALISKLIQCYPGHETLWYHRRFVFHSISHVTESQKESLCYQSGSSNNPGNGYLKKFRLDPNSIMPLKELVQNESDFVEEQLKSADSFHQHLAKRYIDWVKTFFPT